jgi:hypothetical protein
MGEGKALAICVKARAQRSLRADLIFCYFFIKKKVKTASAAIERLKR